jgi:hypothetical protein
MEYSMAGPSGRVASLAAVEGVSVVALQWSRETASLSLAVLSTAIALVRAWRDAPPPSDVAVKRRLLVLTSVESSGPDAFMALLRRDEADAAFISEVVRVCRNERDVGAALA